MAFEAYLYIDGIRGDSTSKIAKDKSPIPGAGPIEISSYGLGIEMPVVENRSSTGAITVGRANFEDFETEKNLDISTSALIFNCLAGTHIPKAVIMIYRSTSDGKNSAPVLYMQIEYESVVITEVGVSGGGDEMPKETLKFNYGSVKYTYSKTDKKTGKATGTTAIFDWNRATNTGTKS